jgi:acylphosphatase
VSQRVAAQILVSGVVQMVGYRAWCARVARALGVAGFVRNLDDGRVEIFAEGDERAIDTLVAQCGRGPTTARVDDVERRARPLRHVTEMVIAPDAVAAEAP